METKLSPIAVMYCWACWSTAAVARETCGWSAPLTLGSVAMMRSAVAVAAATEDPAAASSAGVVVPGCAARASNRCAGSTAGECFAAAVIEA